MLAGMGACGGFSLMAQKAQTGGVDRDDLLGLFLMLVCTGRP